jgi:hypothetical protein
VFDALTFAAIKTSLAFPERRFFKVDLYPRLTLPDSADSLAPIERQLHKSISKFPFDQRRLSLSGVETPSSKALRVSGSLPSQVLPLLRLFPSPDIRRSC